MQEEEDYYKPIKVGHLCSNNNIEYESNDDRNKKLSIFSYFWVGNINCFCVHLLYNKCHKIYPSHGGSYIDSYD